MWRKAPRVNTEGDAPCKVICQQPDMLRALLGATGAGWEFRCKAWLESLNSGTEHAYREFMKRVICRMLHVRFPTQLSSKISSNG